MTRTRDLIEETLASSAHLTKRHVHPRLQRMFEMGGMTAVFSRGDAAYLFDADGNRYLDFLSGGGVHFVGRNHPRVREALTDLLGMEVPNLTVVNASALGGLVAERLLGLAGPHLAKAIFANSGTEATEVSLRFARFVTRRRRYLYLDGAFHGRSYGAISVCGFDELRQGQAPFLPVCTPIPPNDIRQLRRELRHGDVAAFIFEPVQGLTGTVLEEAYLREAESLCEQHGTLMIADEVQTGLGRTGAWFASTAAGVRPSLLTVSKTLSGGMVPVAAVLMSQDVYDRVYARLTQGPIYFSTFAENNLAMAAALATMDALQEMDAPAEAARKGELLRDGLTQLARRYDVIDRVEGKGLMIALYFRDSGHLPLLAQQRLMTLPDGGAFAAAVNVALYNDHRVLVQIPGPGLNAIKVLPPVTATEEDIRWFLSALEKTIEGFYGRAGPLVNLGKHFVASAVDRARELVPPKVLSSLAGAGGSADAYAESGHKKKSVT